MTDERDEEMAVKIGIVGMNGIGNNHAHCYKDDELADVVAVCDVVRERADAAAERHGVKAYYSLKDMIENEPDLQVVDITTGGIDNGSWHFEPAMEAIGYGKHVLVEKPLCNDVREGRELVAFAEKQKVYLGCNLNHYFTAPAEKAKAYMDSGEIGELVYCLAKMGFNGGEANYAPAGSAKISGHPYFHMRAFLTHPFSVMRHFCGDITHIQTFSDRPGFRRSAGDVMVSINSIHVKFANGGVGYLLSQRGDAVYGLGGWWSLEVAGSKGTFCIENCVEKVSFWKAEKGIAAISVQPEPVVTDFGTNDFNRTFNNRLHAFLEDVENKVSQDQLRASGRDALAVLEYVHAVQESYELGGEVVRPHPLPPLHGDPLYLK
ncbi:Gfo/Idh/MocA family oxidoreductase [Paenibacillus cellulositrophicus]|uniref:Gfo/Idh/MocA family protein n=1 Tax=Paenibacillus cellulositrophicus TaxID=562959 RepID=UPI00203FBD77|nr:Gfo/Idh/MocA family oxidoreductase [Paenibacillus cellulositrophicus]MCM2998406.1 Gfo/Idh/MocA family oxidoreductase [Paenibacillus cellulositrophicus]